VRFELTVRVDPVQRFSKPPPSATRPPLRRERHPHNTAFAGGVLPGRSSGVNDGDGPNAGYRRRLRASLTRAGLPLPAIAFITWPTKKPKSFCLPDLYSASLSGLAASTFSTAASMAPVSVT